MSLKWEKKKMCLHLRFRNIALSNRLKNPTHAGVKTFDIYERSLFFKFAFTSYALGSRFIENPTTDYSCIGKSWFIISECLVRVTTSKNNNQCMEEKKQQKKKENGPRPIFRWSFRALNWYAWCHCVPSVTHCLTSYWLIENTHKKCLRKWIASTLNDLY